MTQDESQQVPVCISDERARDTSIPLIISLFIFGAAGISVWRLGESPATSIQVTTLIFLGCIFLVFSGYTYLTSRRIEFYEGFVRVHSRRGEGKDLPYSRLRFQLKQVRGRTGITELGRLSVDGEGRFRLTISDIKIEKLNTTLFQWLPKKIGQPSAVSA